MADVSPVILPTPLSGGRSRVVPLPPQVFLTGTENLEVTSWNSQPGVVVQVQGRAFDAAGTAIPFAFTHTPNTDRSTKIDLFPLTTGAIANMVAFCAAGAPLLGQTFIRVRIIQGFSGGLTPLGTLVQGYITDQQALAWPGTPLQNTLDGGGYVRYLTGISPGPGNPIVSGPPTNARWELVSIIGVLSTDATAGSRWPYVQFSVGISVLAQCSAPADIAASETFAFAFIEGLPLGVLLRPGLIVGGVPTRFPMLVNTAVQVAGGILGPADTWSDVAITVREWLEPA